MSSLALFLRHELLLTNVLIKTKIKTNIVFHKMYQATHWKHSHISNLSFLSFEFEPLVLSSASVSDVERIVLYTRQADLQ